MMNKVELDPKDNRGIFVNGVKIEGIEKFLVEIGDNVTITFPAEIGVKEP